MLGEYKDSGFKEPPFLARRADGQVLQLPRLLYLVAASSDGSRSYGQIAEAVTEQFGRGVSADNVQTLVDSKLRPLGVLAAPDGSSLKLERPNPLLALNFKTAVIPPALVNAVTTVFRPWFWPLVVVAALAGFFALDWWLFFVHGIAQGLRHLVNEPVFFLIVFVLVVLSAALHECGHATACRYGGAHPGVMGVGIYLVWPAFYTDVTDAYRLGKGGRLRTDLGGVYFNALFMLGALGIYLLTHFEVLIAVILLLQFEMLHQFLPFLRLDGYYVIADLTGVPDIFARMKPVLLSLLPWRKPDSRVTVLKGWVRIVVTAWVVLTVAFILYAYGVMLLHMPTIVGTAWASFVDLVGGAARPDCEWSFFGAPARSARASHPGTGMDAGAPRATSRSPRMGPNARATAAPCDKLPRDGRRRAPARAGLDSATGKLSANFPERSRHDQRELRQWRCGLQRRRQARSALACHRSGGKPVSCALQQRAASLALTRRQPRGVLLSGCNSCGFADSFAESLSQARTSSLRHGGLAPARVQVMEATRQANSRAAWSSSRSR